ncbi:MAG: hypothetical protein JXR84_04580 [Anaerolineae bacterium]|nr:hypothetical protein [Anaerolineae bacterium]
MGGGYDLGADECFKIAFDLTQHATPDLSLPGAPLTFTLVLTNTGTEVLHAIITDTLPNTLSLRTMPTQTVFLPDRGVILTWTAVITAPGGVWTRDVIVTVAEDYVGPLTNKVEVTTAEGVSGHSWLIINPRRVYLPVMARKF